MIISAQVWHLACQAFPAISANVRLQSAIEGLVGGKLQHRDLLCVLFRDASFTSVRLRAPETEHGNKIQANMTSLTVRPPGIAESEPTIDLGF